MFTGLIEVTASVRNIRKHGGSWRISIESPGISRRLKTGDSVAVSGVCLTALNISNKSFEADLAAETVAKTSLSLLKTGATVNLELPLKAGSPLGGHIVQGHVDCVAKLISLTRIPGAEDWRLRFRLPAGVEVYVVAKGSITVEGISLTVACIQGRDVEIAVIPHTYAVTNLSNLKAGARLNIEVDVLAKYAAKQATAKDRSITVEKLLSEGF